jgi:hypothetical protein
MAEITDAIMKLVESEPYLDRRAAADPGEKDFAD